MFLSIRIQKVFFKCKIQFQDGTGREFLSPRASVSKSRP